MNAHWSETEIRTLTRMYRAGKSAPQIAAAVGRSVDAVWNKGHALRQQGIIGYRISTKCKLFTCNGQHYCRGFCRLHYDRMMRLQQGMPVRSVNGRRCTVEGCERKHHARGYCTAHYGRAQRRGLVASLGTREGGRNNGEAKSY